MKKLIFFVVLLVVIVAAGWAYYQHRLELAKEQEGKFSPNPAEVYAGILEALQPTLQLHDYSLTMLVPGNRMSEFEWNFRGTLSKESVTPPFYGQVNYICGMVGGDYCWQLGELAVDGRQIELISGTAGGVSTDDAMETDQSGSVGDTGSTNAPELEDTSTPDTNGESSSDVLDKTSSDSAADATDEVAVEEVAVASEEPLSQPQEDVKIWHTTSSAVNARMGPGTDFDIAFKMPTSTPLKLMEQQNGWGRFSYSGQDGKVYSVWLAMSLVENK